MKSTTKQNALRLSALLCMTLTCVFSIRSYASESEGGTSPGGGDTVATASGGRKLLDLAERDDSKFFDFDMARFDFRVQENVSALLSRDHYGEYRTVQRGLPADFQYVLSI